MSPSGHVGPMEMPEPLNSREITCTEIDKRDADTPDNWVPRHPALVRLTGKHPFNVLTRRLPFGAAAVERRGRREAPPRLRARNAIEHDVNHRPLTHTHARTHAQHATHITAKLARRPAGRLRRMREEAPPRLRARNAIEHRSD